MKVKKDSSELANMLLLLKEGKGEDFILTEEDVRIELPGVMGNSITWDKNDPNRRPLDINTRVRIIAKETSPRYKGESYYNYRRIDIGRQWLVLNGSYDVRYTSSMISSFTQEKVKEYVKSRFKYIESSLRFQFTDFREDEGRATLKIIPIEHSFVYVGELTLTFERTTEDNKVPLITAIPNNLLDGFDYDRSIEIGEVNMLGYNYSGRPEGRDD